MSSWIALYLVLHFVRSYILITYYFKQRSTWLIYATVLELICFGMDFYTCVRFISVFNLMYKKAREGLRRTTCWDRWNQTVIFYGIVLVNFLLALYRSGLQLAFSVWFFKHSPDSIA